MNRNQVGCDSQVMHSFGEKPQLSTDFPAFTGANELLH